MSLKKYKFIDLCIFTLIAVAFEALNFFATTKIQGEYQLIFLSYSVILSLICIYRIGICGIIVSLAGGLTACIVAKSSELSQYIAYIVGALSILIPVIIFQYIIGRKTLKKNYVFIPYLIICYIFMIISRCLVLALFNINSFMDTFTKNLRVEVVLESMSLVISIIIAFVANRKNSQLLVESEEYVRYVQERNKLGHLKEYQEAPNFNSDKPFTEFGQIDNSNLLDGGELTAKELKELDDLYKSHQNDNKDESNIKSNKE